jgi:hypothetical protein
MLARAGQQFGDSPLVEIRQLRLQELQLRLFLLQQTLKLNSGTFQVILEELELRLAVI